MHRQAKVWVVDDDSSIRWVLERALTQAGIENESFTHADQLLTRIASEQPDVIISDIRMPGTDGLELLAKINDAYPDLPVIITTAHSDLDSAVASYQRGAFEYLPKPFDLDEVIVITERALAHAREKRGDTPAPEVLPQTEIIGEAPAMQEVFRAIGRLAHSNITVLINGESGTGKELVAQALHRHSPRAAQPFIALNMAAIPKDLMESELFGHEKGAFTGALSRKRGRFERANGGTILLDEIGEMPLEAQVRLLRVLQHREIERLGGTDRIPVDIRVITATNKDLSAMVEAGRFREDLWFRLNVFPIFVPPLRDRSCDIPALVDHFMERKAAELKVGDTPRLAPGAMDALMAYRWPGNVRELENLLERAMILHRGEPLRFDDLGTPLTRGAAEATGEQGQQSLALDEVTAQHIRSVLGMTGGKIHGPGGAGELLGVNPNTLRYKMRKLGIPFRKRERGV